MKVFFVIVWLSSILFSFLYSSYRFKKKLEKEHQLKIKKWKETIIKENLETDVSLEIEAQIDLNKKLETLLFNYISACKVLDITAIADLSFISSVLKKYPSFIENPISNSFKFTQENKETKLKFIYVSKYTKKSFIINLTIEDLINKSDSYLIYFNYKYKFFF